MQRGKTVRILIRAGVLAHETGMKFCETVEAGTLGVYEGRHPDPQLKRQGWHLIKVGSGFVPLHKSQFRLSGESEDFIWGA